MPSRPVTPPAGVLPPAYAWLDTAYRLLTFPCKACALLIVSDPSPAQLCGRCTIARANYLKARHHNIKRNDNVAYPSYETVGNDILNVKAALEMFAQAEGLLATANHNPATAQINTSQAIALFSKGADLIRQAHTEQVARWYVIDQLEAIGIVPKYRTRQSRHPRGNKHPRQP